MRKSGLREFMVELEERGELSRITEEVDGFRIFDILWKTYDETGPALIFENVKGREMQIVSNVLGTLDRWAMACGFATGKNAKDYRDMFVEKLEDKKSWPKAQRVETGPCKEVILKGEDARFSKLPILQWHPGDAGPYITMGACITDDDKYGPNVGTYRMMIHDDITSGIMCNIFQHQGMYLSRARKKGREKIDCAVAIGVDPALSVAAVTTIGLDESELDFAGALQGSPVHVVKAETIDIEVPADAEVIIEGEISTTEHKSEGPFGEYMGHFEDPLMLPVFKLKCITHRKDAFYQTTTVAHPKAEGNVMDMISMQAPVFQQAQERITGFVDAWMIEASRNFMIAIAIKKHFPGWGMQAVHQALGMPFMAAMSNNVIVVDASVNIRDLEELVWAISTRADPAYDVLITRPVVGYGLNPAARTRPSVSEKSGSDDFLICSKMGIDATIKMKDEREGRGVAIPVRPIGEMI